MILRVILACFICRFARWGCNLLGRGGTSFPGKLALKICPDILSYVSRNVHTVIVTGTNGKTTTVKMLCAMLAEQGTDLFTNRTGANLAPGITAEYIFHADWLGRAKHRYAVIESDEAALKRVSGTLKPDVILVTNIFRDQLDRYGEVTQTLAEIREGIRRTPNTRLCLNADCSLTASLADERPDGTVFFGMNVEKAETSVVSDAPRCIRCGEKYEYRFRTFAHLGSFYCPACGYARPEPDVCALETEILSQYSRVKVRSGDREFTCEVNIPAFHNVNNAIAALCTIKALGLDEEEASTVLSHMEAGFGRMEAMNVDGTDVRIVLVKNPAGCDRALDYLSSQNDNIRTVFCLNDNVNDGTDISWIWDAQYEKLFEKLAPTAVGVYGTRAGDMKLRLKYAGVEESLIRVLPDTEAILSMVRESNQPMYILPNYTSMLAVRDAVAKAAGKGSFWE